MPVCVPPKSRAPIGFEIVTVLVTVDWVVEDIVGSVIEDLVDGMLVEEV